MTYLENLKISSPKKKRIFDETDTPIDIDKDISEELQKRILQSFIKKGGQISKDGSIIPPSVAGLSPPKKMLPVLKL